MHCRMCSSVPGLCLPDASSTALPPPAVTTKCVQTLPNVPLEGRIAPRRQPLPERIFYLKTCHSLWKPRDTCGFILLIRCRAGHCELSASRPCQQALPGNFPQLHTPPGNQQPWRILSSNCTWVKGLFIQFICQQRALTVCWAVSQGNGAKNTQSEMN